MKSLGQSKQICTATNDRADRHAHRTDEGFTLIELLIVMSVMLVLMTLGIPQLLKLRKQANETSAMQSVRVIEQAEITYHSSFPANGFACTLPSLGGDPKSGAPSSQSAQLIESSLSTGQKAGYTFTIACGAKSTINNQDKFDSFEVNAVPQSVGKTGDRGFCMDENNTLRADPAGGTNCTQQIQ